MTDENLMNQSGDDVDSPEPKLSASQERLNKYRLFAIKPEEIDDLWNAADPSDHC